MKMNDFIVTKNNVKSLINLLRLTYKCTSISDLLKYHPNISCQENGQGDIILESLDFGLYDRLYVLKNKMVLREDNGRTSTLLAYTDFNNLIEILKK